MVKKDKEFRKFLEDELCKVKEMSEGILFGYEAGIYDSYTYLLKKYDEFHKPVVVPKFVGEWIEESKKQGKKLCYQFGYVNVSAPFSKRKDYLFEHSETFARAWLDGYEVEEEPAYYALAKGHELIKGKGRGISKYWNVDTTDGCVFISDRSAVRDKYLIKTSKSEWSKFGINDSNADFVEVEEGE